MPAGGRREENARTFDGMLPPCGALPGRKTTGEFYCARAIAARSAPSLQAPSPSGSLTNPGQRIAHQHVHDAASAVKGRYQYAAFGLLANFANYFGLFSP